MPQERPYVFDASRLVWRLWRGRLPTGIDRVCLAYLDEFAPQSLAMLQWRDRRVVLGARCSDRLFALLRAAAARRLNRTALVALLAGAIPIALLLPPVLAGRVYLNVGHTGLDIASLPPWLRRRGLRPVYLIHDLIPITHPAFCRPGEAEKHARRMTHALASAAGFIVNSQATGDELAAFAASRRLALAPVLVAHLGLEALPDAPLPAPHDRPYFLSVGTIEARKNHLLLLRVWQRLRGELGRDAPDLVLIGQRGWEADEAFALLDAPQDEWGRVIELGQCGDAELAAWIDHARALLMPSQAEGYGLPVIEALARGTPVIASDLAVYRELAGTIPLLLEPGNESAWRGAVLACRGNAAERQRQCAALADFSAPRWPGHMARVRGWLQTI